MFNKFNIAREEQQVYQISEEMHVNYISFIKFGAVSYNN